MKGHATIIGATGLVGSHLLRLVLEDERFSSVTALGRRATGVRAPKLTDAVVDFRAPATFAALVRGDVLFSALGTTIGAAGSEAAQYEVDHGFQLAVARAARANGVPALVVVSSAGASPGSRLFYARMKGALERDVEALGFERLRLLRPGILDGERRERRAGERWALRVLRPLAPVLPAPLRPVHAAAVARAAIHAALDPTPGCVRVEAAEIFRLGAATAPTPR
jgi:uncharacterized protein YbjT (DUF2867 family)